MKRPDAIQLLSVIVAAFPVPAWETPTIRLYASELEEFELEDVEAAIKKWIRTRTERPTIAHLRTAIADERHKRAQVARLEERRREVPSGTRISQRKFLRQIVEDLAAKRSVA